MALNFPYRHTPISMFELFERPLDPYKRNYNKAFELGPGEPYLEWNESLGTWQLPQGKPNGQPE